MNKHIQHLASFVVCFLLLASITIYISAEETPQPACDYSFDVTPVVFQHTEHFRWNPIALDWVTEGSPTETSAEGQSTVTVQNTGNTQLAIQISFQPAEGYEAVVCTFENTDPGEPYEGVLEPESEALTVSATLSNLPFPETIEDGAEGTVGTFHLEVVSAPSNLMLPDEIIEEEPPTVDEPIAEEPPTADEPIVEEPPTVDEPIADEPIVEEPPTADEPIVEEPPTANEPIVEEPPATEEPNVEEPPAADDPIIDEPTASDEPVAEEPIRQEVITP